MTTATRTTALAFVTAETALAAYQLACTTGAPGAFEAAAHALASALQLERARRRAPRPSAGARPRLVVDNAPKPNAEAAPAARKPKEQSARVAGPDLDAPVTVPKRAAAVGAFHALWADGTVTRVSCISWRGSKPETRWARAYQAANRLRRQRAGRHVAQDLERTAIVDRWARGAFGMKVTSPAWAAYMAAVPMPPLAAIHCETTGEIFDAPEGSAFGAGDPDVARELEARLCTPRLPWAEAEARAIGGDLIQTAPEVGTVYVIHDADRRVGGSAHAAPWCAPFRALRIREVQAACDHDDFMAGRTINKPKGPPVLGHRLTTARVEDVAGTTVAVCDAAAKEGARQAEAEAAAAKSRAAESAAHARAAVLERVARLAGHVWTLRRDVGGRTFTLLRDGHGATLPVWALPFLCASEGYSDA